MNGEVEGLNNLLSVLTNIITLLSIIFTVSLLFRKKISESSFYKKVRSKIGFYYLKIIENKVLIGSIISASIGVILILFAIFSLFSSTILPHTYYPDEIIQKELGKGVIFNYAFDKPAILIEKGQFFEWSKGWSTNKKLKKIELFYYAPYETQIRVNLYFNTTDYQLYGKSTLVIENISLPYLANTKYGMSFINVGKEPIYLFSIKIEEEQKPIQQSILILLIGYLFLMTAMYLHSNNKNTNIVLTPLDQLYKVRIKR